MRNIKLEYFVNCEHLIENYYGYIQLEGANTDIRLNSL